MILVTACAPEFATKRKATSLGHFDISVPALVKGCEPFTIKITAYSTKGDVLTSYAGDAQWSDLLGALAPITPAPFVNGVSTTTAQILSAGLGNSVTVNSGGVSASSSPFQVNGNVPYFSGLSFANVRLDRSFDLVWNTGLDDCGGSAGVSSYDLFEANSAGAFNFSDPNFTTAGSSLQRQSFPAVPTGTIKYFIARARSGSITETNAKELSVRFDSLAMATLAGGRNLDDSTALNGSVRAQSLDVDLYGNVFFITDPSWSSVNTVAVYCVGRQGVCAGKTPGKTYVVSGAGGTGSLTQAETFSGASFTYQAPSGIRLDAYGNAHVLEMTAARDYVTCLTKSGICRSVSGNSIDYSGGGSPAKIGNVYNAGDIGSAGSKRLALDSAGNAIYASFSSNRIHVKCINTAGWCSGKTAGNLYTIAGGGGAYADNGPATATSLNQPYGISLDRFDNIVFSDLGNYRVRKICAVADGGVCSSATPGNIYLVAGTGAPGSSGDDDVATVAALNHVTGLRLDSAGNIIIADTLNSTIRVICHTTSAVCRMIPGAVAGNIYRLAGTTGTPGASGDGGRASDATLSATELAIDPFDNVLLTGAESGLFDSGTMTVRHIVTRVICSSTAGICADVTGGNVTPRAGGPAAIGRIYRVMGNQDEAVAADGVDATKATLREPTHATTDSAGNVVITSRGNHKVHVVCKGTAALCAHVSGSAISTSGAAAEPNTIYTLAGSGWSVNSGDGSALAPGAGLPLPYATVVEPTTNNVVISDTTSHVIRVVCMTPGSGVCAGFGGAGGIYTLAGTKDSHGYSGDGGPATGAQFSEPRGLALDSADNVIVADTNNNAVRIICFNALGPYCSSVGSGATAGKVVDAGGGPATAGYIYSIAGLGTAGGYSGEGGPAYLAQLSGPMSVAVDSADNLAIADTGNHRVRMVCRGTNNLCRSTVGARIQNGGGGATAGHIYLAAGTGIAIFGGDSSPSFAAAINTPNGAGFDSNSNLIISDTNNSRVRIVCNSDITGVCEHADNGTGLIDPAATAAAGSAAFNIYTLAGNGSNAYGGDGYIASDSAYSKIGGPVYAFGDASGHVIIVDRTANRVRFTF